MSNTAIGLTNLALIKLGATAIGSFSDGSAEAEAGAALYEPTLLALLSVHPWSFATTQATLGQLVVPPLADYDFAFQLPADFVRALSVGSSGFGRGLSFRIVGRTLQADSDTVVLTYLCRPDESGLPPYFVQALISRLAAELCLPLTESTSRATMLAQLAEVELRRARLIDGQQETRIGFEDFSLIGARL